MIYLSNVSYAPNILLILIYDTDSFLKKFILVIFLLNPFFMRKETHLVNMIKCDGINDIPNNGGYISI